MSERQQAMIRAFAEYEQKHNPETVGPRHNIVGMPLGTRLLRMMRRRGCWWLWLATKDYIYGTYLCVYDDGSITRVTIRGDEGDEEIQVRPSDDEIRRMLDE